MQGKAIVSRDEIDTGIRAAARIAIQIGTARKAIGKLCQRLILAAPEVPHTIAVFAVPLRP